jgi:predicted dehydrogenase
VLREPRIEVLLHSIHYLSLFAYFFGEPDWIQSIQHGDPNHPVLCDRDICSTTALGYARASAPELICDITCNHLSTKPRSEWRSELTLDGTNGRIVAKIADNLDYPNGVNDALHVEHDDFGQHAIALIGNRFPMAFVATMGELQLAAATNSSPANDLSLGLRTMRMVESCYDSNAMGGARRPMISAKE